MQEWGIKGGKYSDCWEKDNLFPSILQGIQGGMDKKCFEKIAWYEFMAGRWDN